MASRKLVVAAAIAALTIIAGAVIADWMIVTDEERVEELIDVVTGRVDHDSIDRALGWTDLSRQPLEVSFRGQSYRFDSDDAESLRTSAFTHLAAYQGERLTLLQKHIEMKGTSATVTVDTLSRRGRTTVDYELRKSGARWLLSGVHVR